MRYKVLVIEDDRDMAEMLQLTLSPMFDVTICTEKAHAIKQAKAYFDEHGCPDVLVVDLIINGEGGLNFYQWMKDRGYYAPVIFLTGCHRQSPEFQEALETGERVYEKDHFSSATLAEYIQGMVVQKAG